jgi:hypothetical protein
MSAAVDFLRAPSPPLAGRALLFAGVLALTAALVSRQDVVAERARLDAETQARHEQERRQRLALRPVEPTVAEKRARHALVEAKTPWLRTLRAIETTTEAPVFLRSLVIDPSGGVVKLEAEAPTFAEAVAFAQALAEDPMLQPALLTSHEVVADPASTDRVVRFGIAARWNRR